MRIHCLLMIGCVLSNDSDFPLILIIIGNELQLRGLNSLDRRGDGIRTYTTKKISKSRTISDGRYIGSAQSALLLSPSLPRPCFSNFISFKGEGTEIEPSLLNETCSAPRLRLSVGGVIKFGSLGNWISSSSDRQGIDNRVKRKLKCVKHKLKQWQSAYSKSCNPQCMQAQGYGPVGGRRLKCGLSNRYVIVVISELFQNNHADLQSVTPALAHDPSVNYSTAQRPKRRGFKFEKNSRKGCDTFEEKTFWTPRKHNCSILRHRAP
jgi:hypothetical protein